MKLVPLVLVVTDDLATQEIQSSSFKIKFVQVRKKATYSDLKKRIADCVSKLKSKTYTQDQLRLWLCPSDVDLLGNLAKVAAALNQSQSQRS